MPTFRKNNHDKPRWSRLARLPGHDCLLKAMERNDFGAAQYGDQNWRNGTVDAYLDALMRHALALCGGQTADSDDPGAMAHGLEHTDAIVWNALVLSELIAARQSQTDNHDKPKDTINVADIDLAASQSRRSAAK